MEKIIDLIATDSSASEISDAIKDAIFTKAAEKIDAIKPEIASTIFSENETEYSEDNE